MITLKLVLKHFKHKEHDKEMNLTLTHSKVLALYAVCIKHFQFTPVYSNFLPPDWLTICRICK